MALTTKLRLKVFVVPPGKFFDPARKQNLLIINTGYNYIYTLRSHLAGFLTIIIRYTSVTPSLDTSVHGRNLASPALLGKKMTASWARKV